MGIFVDWLDISFRELSNKKVTVLTADIHTLRVTGINISNQGEQDIRLNLKKVSIQIPASNSTDIFLLSDFEIKGRSSVNLVDIIGEQTLRFSMAPNIIENLICFSNGYTQKYDCDISYMQLNELPLTP